ncbi:hypothetical protein SCLCIDRAFT_244184 [Scleroderma citrinum Foug A]|uniref:Uncharacterized protein n=1 Tax=Scleroderma citrinum Foug A TaxID=1036808 RepID=A0A0C3DJ50_9AGAM|nr:hypothetical protein SCLCIDRAFT_244184 [Scleroderma citrinum Foug A]
MPDTSPVVITTMVLSSSAAACAVLDTFHSRKRNPVHPCAAAAASMNLPWPCLPAIGVPVHSVTVKAHGRCNRIASSCSFVSSPLRAHHIPSSSCLFIRVHNQHSHPLDVDSSDQQIHWTNIIPK